MQSACRSIVGAGVGGVVIDIECRLTNNLPAIVIVGSAGRTVSEAKDRIRAAFVSSKLQLPRRRITINLAPADIPKSDSGLDAAMAVAILAASQELPDLRNESIILGELGLTGDMRPVRGIIGKILAAKQRGVSEYFVPQPNMDQARLIPGVSLYPVDDLRQLHEHLSGVKRIVPLVTSGSQASLGLPTHTAVNPFKGIVGQETAKRAASIAAAGGHNLLLNGPPGSGKTLVARAMASLLPPLTTDEALEVTHLHSLAGRNFERLITERPFRMPHHTISTTGLIGGGRGMQPAEISFSHRGILLLDELPEFQRAALEALRQPLEDKSIRLRSPTASANFPADFILVATANPCPCGFAGLESNRCKCSAAQLRRYRTKLSGPLLDRIDLHCEMSPVLQNKVLADSQTHDQDYRKAIWEARLIQHKRYDSTTLLNAALTPQQVYAYCKLSSEAKQMLNQAAEVLGMSTRSLMRTIKVARTIADLDGRNTIDDGDIGEAIRYRQSSVSSSV